MAEVRFKGKLSWPSFVEGPTKVIKNIQIPILRLKRNRKKTINYLFVNTQFEIVPYCDIMTIIRENIRKKSVLSPVARNMFGDRSSKF